jgi:hypothetical protein
VFPITKWGYGNDVVEHAVAAVPGDLVSQLEADTDYGDPLFHLNFKNNAYDGPNWHYSAAFDAPSGWTAPDTLLVFDSVKMGAVVTLNGKTLGELNNQFLRYNFSVGALLKPTGNALTVAFHASTDASNFEGRFQACSGGWDWAPYSSTATAQGDPTFSRGILRDVYLVPVKVASLPQSPQCPTRLRVDPPAPKAQHAHLPSCANFNDTSPHPSRRRPST